MSPDSRPTLYDRNFFMAMASQTCFVVANTLMAHYARWVEFLGGSVLDVGWVMSAGAVLGLFLRPWMGQWINRLGPQVTWQIGYAVFAVGSLGNLAVDDLGPMIYLLRSCIVLGAAIVFASSLTYISQLAPANRQAEAIGILGAGGFIGMLLGPILGDLILGADMRSRGDFGLLFVIAGLGNILPALLVWRLRAPAEGGRSRAARLSDFAITVRRFWPGMILAVDFAFGVSLAVPLGFLASYIDQVPLRIPGVSMMGLFFGCYAGWGLLVRVVLRRIPERLGRRKVLLCGMLFMSVGLLAYLLVDAHRPWMLVVPALLTGTAHSLMFHTMTSLTIDSFPRDVRGTGSALALMMLDLGTIAGAPVLAQIASQLGFKWMYATTAMLMFVASAAYYCSCLAVWRERREGVRSEE